MNDGAISTSELADVIGARLTGSGNEYVNDVTHDSRQAGPGTIFTAIEGATQDGHRFVEDVMRRGAAGVISDRDVPEGFEGCWFQVEDTRASLAAAAAAVHGDPTSRLDLVGITGTNGKTTTTYLVFAILAEAGKIPAMLTTVEYRIGDESETAVRTTPEASDTQRFFKRAVEAGSSAAVMEASSQAIDLKRCDGLRFAIAVFTNLTRDHLDYHLTMQNYFDAKKKLFDGRLGSSPRLSVINIDDEWGRKLRDGIAAAGGRTATTSLSGKADLFASGIEVSLSKGTSFRMTTPVGSIDMRSPLIGKPHVYNILSASAVGLELGIDLETISSALSKCAGAPGRFEPVPHDGNFAVIVDYAHTDDALVNTLSSAGELAEGRIITVMGCGGDRDRSKRVPMGKAAGELSDIVIVTSDNPRTEDPLKIIAEIEKGLKPTGCEYLVSPDRREAIKLAIEKAEKGDVVLIAGKGHETYQIVGTDRFHFDDREIAAEALEMAIK